MNHADLVHIAGMLVHVRPEVADDIVARLGRGDEAYVRDCGVPGKLAVVLECGSEQELGAYIDRIRSLSGVLGVSMTSHYVEERGAMDIEVEP